MKYALILGGFAALLHSSLMLEAAEKKPNIVMIMTDDVGWGDLGCYGGGENRGCLTPNLDRMAQEGMRFTNILWAGKLHSGAGFISSQGAFRFVRHFQQYLFQAI